ncbi:MAG: Peptidase thermolysin, partial [Bacteroidota bacterium]|nr:Peptidase thermolysin [Bacteroidota bacterium]
CIVPPYIMDQFEGHFKHSVEFSKRVHADRLQISYQTMGPSLTLQPPGKADRLIYDSKNTSMNAYQLVRKEGDPEAADPAANRVYDNCGKVRDFYKNNLNYFSVDNNGKDLAMNIHYQEELNNAMWDGRVSQMFFGDGDGDLLTNLTGPIDVIGHEMTHGVVQYTAGLIYQGQSGALNEHIADVFGTVIKQFYNKENASTGNWLIGEDVLGPSFKAMAIPGFGVALRSLKDPGKAYNQDPQPAHMDNFNTGSSDNGGVHINSGILNKVFYLVATGKGMPIAGLDTPTAGKLWFEALKAIRVDTCDFEGFAKIVLSSAKTMMIKKLLAEGTDTLIEAAFGNVGIELPGFNALTMASKSTNGVTTA